MERRVAFVACAGFAACLIQIARCEPTATSRVPVYLDQGWTDAERDQFYFTTQGSQLIPYEWFLALEQAENDELFRSDPNMERLGFLASRSASARNPDGLPVGFVKDDDPATVDYAIKESFLGDEFRETDYPSTNAWLGLTCAACHTSELQVDDVAMRIDGGPALADTQAFLKELSAAVEAAHRQDDKFVRFAGRVLVTGNEGERTALRNELRAYAPVLARLVRRGEGTTPYGYGRLDAFGSILNEICETALELSGNHHPADAPASYPFLWNTPQLNWVQWNGSAANPMARNVGEVLGVFAQLKLTATPPQDQYRATAHFRNLWILEQHIDRLQAPKWPEEILGDVDEALARSGAELFGMNCAHCHVVRDSATGEFPRTAANALGRRFIRIVMVPLAEIRTDPALARNFAERTANPGVLADQLGNAPQVPRSALLGIVVRHVIKRKISESQPPLDAAQIAAISGFRGDERPPNVMAYKARPLNGAWATAPFLHNGSVPTLFDLLLPEAERPTSFYVGSRKFDTERVGFESSASPSAFRFNVVDEEGVAIPGNSNAGHSGHFYTQCKGDDGAWRDYTEEERLALVEYLKMLQ